jgi:hopanoid biosynthesis associated protein HpnK
VRRLIINADDFGLTTGVNRAIQLAHSQGVVTSATLMAKSQAFDHAVEMSRSLPALSLGCHVVLVDGTPLLPPSQVPSLLQRRGPNADYFPFGFGDIALRAIAGKINPDEARAEVTGQFRKLQTAGISISHFDAHKHTHILPWILSPLLRAAADCGVPALRNPFAPRGSLHPSLLFSWPTLWKRSLQMSLLRGFARKFRELVRHSGMATTDGTIGIEVTGVLDERFFQVLVKNMPQGTWELVCHPGYNDADLSGIRTRLRESREHELRALTSPDAHQILDRAGIELISFRHLRA